VGWKIGAEVVYLAEGNAAGTGAAIKWAHDLGEEDYQCAFTCKVTSPHISICIFTTYIQI